MDTPEFQRLAGLRQLGFSDVVYRGARHSRLEHSIGTYLACKQIMRRIVQNHERLNLDHPGEYISNNYRVFPANAKMSSKTRSFQARWRGLMEVVSVAALLHDLGHVPFGHTLEDEFAGIFHRHDRLAGPRLYEMLFNEQSDLAKVFSGNRKWLPHLTDQQIRELIYLMLSWKEQVGPPPRDFPELLQAQKQKASGTELVRLEKLEECFSKYATGAQSMFQPFMSDIIGNTICADLLDYLPRDRVNLGMEARRHDRLQRYFTIRRGGLHHNEGYRMSIMVTRPLHGGQRRDVASSVLAIMRERFEMAEAVYYHHKKASASSMLAKLAEISDMVDADAEKHGTDKRTKPRDDDEIYPAPWSDGYAQHPTKPPHMTHLSDAELIDYLGKKLDVKFADNVQTERFRKLQKQLHLALRYRRRGMYRTLLVIDTDLVNRDSPHDVSFFVTEWRGHKESPNNANRLALEHKLSSAANGQDGDVILYCPDGNMQSKLIDARLEIDVNRILPLRRQTEFVYRRDIETLGQYYESLWRAYIFVSPTIFESRSRCESIVKTFCAEYGFNWDAARHKMRGHDLTAREPMKPAATSRWKRADVVGLFDDHISADGLKIFQREKRFREFVRGVLPLKSGGRSKVIEMLEAMKPPRPIQWNMEREKGREEFMSSLHEILTAARAEDAKAS
jgi:HD superfamily phosphohydrolase